jgi:hypothetical protein
MNCDLCARPADVEVDIRRRMFWGGHQTKTWTLCTPHREVMDGWLARFSPEWWVVAERNR